MRARSEAPATGLMRRYSPPAARLVAVIVLIAAGCTPVRYEYTEPATAEGRTCTDRCAGPRQTCESRVQIMAQKCHANYQVQMAQYSMCKQSGRRLLCLAPDACPEPDDSQCILDFNDCFAACGGQIKEIPVN
ncbi:MAG: hypothetical protein U1E42_03125 [Rhodospirillales bacterium]